MSVKGFSILYEICELTNYYKKLRLTIFAVVVTHRNCLVVMNIGHIEAFIIYIKLKKMNIIPLLCKINLLEL